MSLILLTGFQESRVLKFWFAVDTDYLDKVTGAYEFFKELVKPDNFPRGTLNPQSDGARTVEIMNAEVTVRLESMLSVVWTAGTSRLTISVLQACCAVTTEYGITSDFVRKSTASLLIKFSTARLNFFLNRNVIIF